MIRFINYIKKSFKSFFWILDKLNKKAFMQIYPKYLRWLGVQIDTDNIQNTWISPTVFFDSADCTMIKIGKDVTISFDTVILIHDFSIKHVARLIKKENDIKSSKKSPVEIGNNVFIGAKCIILPGTKIPDNCIIGAGAVVKGTIETGGVYCGNPAKHLCSVEDLASKYELIS